MTTTRSRMSCIAMFSAAVVASPIHAQVHIRVPQAAPPIRITPLFKTDESIEFGRIVALAVSKANDIYAADGQQQSITRLSSSGALVKTFGRKGKGPGEFRDLTTLTWRGDTLVGVDASAWRLTMFDVAGTLLETMEWPQPPNTTSRYVTAWPAVALSQDGGILIKSRPLILRKDTAGKPRSTCPKPVYATIRSDNSAKTYDASFDTIPGNGNFDCPAPRGVIAILHPFFPVPGPWRAVSGSKLISADPASYSIRLINLETGKPITILDRQYPIQKVDDKTWSVASAEYRDTEQKLGRLDCGLHGVRPRIQPVISSIVTDEKGNIWVESKTADGYHLSGLTVDGKLLGEVKMPMRDMSVPFVIRGDRLYIVTKDADDVQHVQAFQLQLARR